MWIFLGHNELNLIKFEQLFICLLHIDNEKQYLADFTKVNWYTDFQNPLLFVN